MITSVSTNDLPKLWDDSRLRAYLGEVNRRHGVVDTLALPNMRDLPPIRIESLFVQPLLSQSSVSPISAPETWPEGQSLFATLQSAPCLILLGDPGSGKTTLVNWLAWRLSAGFTTPLPSMLDERLPIPCVLREMKSAAFAAEITIADLAVMVAERLLGEKVNAALKANLRARVKAKQYVLILDGVDEIPRAQRNTVAAWMQQAARDGACALATSRVVGYEDSPVDRPYSAPLAARLSKSAMQIDEALLSQLARVDEEFGDGAAVVAMQNLSNLAEAQELFMREQEQRDIGETSWAQTRYLMPFDQKRIAAFAENWYLQRSGSEQEARQKTEDLMFALSQSEVTQELARTPNLLSLMAIVHRERAHLPDGKALLYKEIANAYINTIDQHRNITIDDGLAPYGWEVRENWLAFVGFQMQMERDAAASDLHESGVLVSQEKVLGWLTQAMEDSGVSKAQLSAKTFLEWVARRSGLLLPRGEDLFAFVHLSFQEYFCARYLAGRIISPKFVKDKLSDDAPVTKEKLKEWSTKALWCESLVYLLELISGERGTDWVEDLTEILFGTMEEEWGLEEDSAGLAVRILIDRHIHLRVQWKRVLAQRCSSVAEMEWRYMWGEPDRSVLRALLRTGYAAIFASPSSLSDRRHQDLPVRELSNLQEVQANSDLYLLIVTGEEVQDISMLAGLKGLIHLALDGTQVSDISALVGMESLKKLDLSGTQVQDISPLAGMNSLNILYLSGSQVQDISPLAGMNSLNMLFLSGTQVQDISALTGMENLGYLNLNGTQVQDISALAELKNLRGLQLGNTQVRDIFVLAELGQLGRLGLNGTQVQNISALARLKRLGELDLSDTQVQDISVFAGMKRLRELNLSNTSVQDISTLAGLELLMDLNLSNTLVQDISALAGLERLRELNLSNTRVRDISTLAGLERLMELNLSNTQVQDTSALVGIERLRALNLSNTRVQDISALAGMNRLRELNLSDTSVQDISALAEMVNLRNLDISNTQVQDVSVLDGLTGLEITRFKNG